jgi:hypothetical protein
MVAAVVESLSHVTAARHRTEAAWMPCWLRAFAGSGVGEAGDGCLVGGVAAAGADGDDLDGVGPGVVGSELHHYLGLNVGHQDARSIVALIRVNALGYAN